MRSTILLLASLFSTSLALPHSNERYKSTTASQFLIEDYNPGCGDSPAGCLYSFNLTIENPEFTVSTSCDGTDILGDTFGSCTVPSVTSHELAQFQFFTLFVNYTYTVEDKKYTDMGSVNITDVETSGQSFTIVPTTVVECVDE